MGVVILVRHGETQLNADGHIRGWLQCSLTEKGFKQAEQIAGLLACYDVRHLCASPLARAVQTAAEIAITTGRAVYTDRGLMPWDVGSWAGCPVDKVLPLMKKAEETDEPAPGGGESFSQFKRRFLRFLMDRLEDEYEGDIVLVTHTRNVQCAKGWLAAGAAGYEIDKSVMDDYKNEMPCSHALILTARGDKVTAKEAGGG